MIQLEFPLLDIDATIKIDENGVNINMKKFDINNFTIDKVFKHIDKICGKKSKKEKKSAIKNNSTNEGIENDDVYHIEIQL